MSKFENTSIDTLVIFSSEDFGIYIGVHIEKNVKLKERTVRKDAVKLDGTAMIIKLNTPSG